MPEFVIDMLLMGCGAILALLGVLVGGWLMFRGKSSLPDESFIGKRPKGEVFTIDTGDLEEFPETGEPLPEEKRVLEKTETFLKSLGGE